jgi:hypothetical protein
MLETRLSSGQPWPSGRESNALAGGSFATTQKITNLFIYFPLPLAPNFKSIPYCMDKEMRCSSSGGLIRPRGIILDDLPAGLRALDADGVYNRSVRRYTTGAKTVRLQYSGESRQATL